MTIRLTDPTDHLGHDSRDEQARVEQLLDYLEDPEAPSCGCCGGVFTDGTPDNSLCAVCEQGELHADNDAVETAVEDCLGPDSTVWLWHPDDRWHCRADTTVENAVATDPWRSPTAVTWEPAVTEGRDVDRSTWNTPSRPRAHPSWPPRRTSSPELPWSRRGISPPPRRPPPAPSPIGWQRCWPAPRRRAAASTLHSPTSVKRCRATRRVSAPGIITPLDHTTLSATSWTSISKRHANGSGQRMPEQPRHARTFDLPGWPCPPRVGDIPKRPDSWGLIHVSPHHNPVLAQDELGYLWTQAGAVPTFQLPDDANPNPGAMVFHVDGGIGLWVHPRSYKWLATISRTEMQTGPDGPDSWIPIAEISDKLPSFVVSPHNP